MKKLNRTEISVLAKKISEEINSENQKKKEALLKAYKPSAKFVEFTKTLQTAQKACSKIYKAIGYRITIDIKDLQQRFIAKELNLERFGRVWYNELEDEIILAQVECPDLNAVIEQIKQKHLI